MRPAVRILLLTLCCLACLRPMSAQSHQWQWAGAQPFTVNAVATDAQGNAYVTGRFSGTITLAGSQYTCTNNLYDLVVAKYNPQGQVVWATILNAQPRYAGLLTGIYSSGDDIGVNPATGEAYVAGSMNGRFAAAVPGTNLSTDYTMDKLLIMKLSAAGQMQWAVMGGSTYAPPRATALAIDAQGNSYLTGSGYGFQLGNGGSVPMNSRQLFAMSLTGAGVLRWSMASYTPLSAAGSDIDVDAQNGVYVLGSYNGPLTIGGTTLPNASPGTVMVKLDASSGAVQWSRTPTGAGALAVDPAGRSYLVGGFTGTYTLGGAAVTATSSRETFLAQLDAGGAVSWLRTLGASQGGAGVVISSLGPMVVLKRTATDAAVLGLQADGSPGWEEPASGISVSQRLAVAPGTGPQQGRILVVGSCGSPATFGAYTISTAGSFLASLQLQPAIVPDANGLAVYPNPAHEQLTLMLPTTPGLTAQLLNLRGRIVKELRGTDGAGPAQLTWDVQALPRGIYTLRVIGGSKVLTRQVALE